MAVKTKTEARSGIRSISRRGIVKHGSRYYHSGQEHQDVTHWFVTNVGDNYRLYKESLRRVQAITRQLQAEYIAAEVVRVVASLRPHRKDTHSTEVKPAKVGCEKAIDTLDGILGEEIDDLDDLV